MSAEATGQVWRYSPYTGAQLLVHLAIADVVNDVHGNEFWMSTPKLAIKARVSRSSVTRTLAQMVADGFLKVVAAGSESRKPTRYLWITPPVTSVIWEPTSVIWEGSLASPRRTELIANTKDLTATSALVTLVDAKCPRCHGHGTYWSGSGHHVDCPCTKPKPEINDAGEVRL